MWVNHISVAWFKLYIADFRVYASMKQSKLTFIDNRNDNEIAFSPQKNRIIVEKYRMYRCKLFPVFQTVILSWYEYWWSSVIPQRGTDTCVRHMSNEGLLLLLLIISDKGLFRLLLFSLCISLGFFFCSKNLTAFLIYHLSSSLLIPLFSYWVAKHNEESLLLQSWSTPLKGS